MDVERLRRPGGPDLRGTEHELHVLERALPATPASTALARMTARVACRAWRVPHVADDAVLLASELVTAAVRATVAFRVVLRVRMTPRRLRIEVYDPSGLLVPAVGDDRVAEEPRHDHGPRDHSPQTRTPATRMPFDRVRLHQVPRARVPLDRLPVGRARSDQLASPRVTCEPVPMDRVQQEVVRALTCRCGIDPAGPGSQAWGELALEAEPQTR